MRRLQQDGFEVTLPSTTPQEPRDLLKGPTRAGFVIVFLFFVVFCLWGGTAPIAGGAFANGSVAPDGSVRSVQHLEGGLVEAILVRDGEHVEPGQPLLTLRKVGAEADVESLLDRRRARLAESARLDAEAKSLEEVAFPPELIEDPKAAAVVDAETRVLRARRIMLETRKDVLRQRIAQLEEQIDGHDAQLKSATTQIELIQQEYDDKAKLVEKRITPRVELLRLGRALAEVQGLQGEYVAAMAQARQQIGVAEVELMALDAERSEEVTVRLSHIRGELAEIEQVLASRQDVLARTELTAPVGGIISNLKIKTEGAVVGAGEVILDIVPTEEKLVIDVQLSPLDIDVAEVGMEAQVHLPALSGRSAPRLFGAVTNISADLVVNERTGQSHYVCRVEVPADEMKKLGTTELTVGMPAEVIIVSRERTMIEYVFEPIMNAFRRASREV